MKQFAIHSGRVTEWHACILMKFDFLDGWTAEKGSGWDLTKGKCYLLNHTAHVIETYVQNNRIHTLLYLVKLFLVNQFGGLIIQWSQVIGNGTVSVLKGSQGQGMVGYAFLWRSCAPVLFRCRKVRREWQEDQWADQRRDKEEAAARFRRKQEERQRQKEEMEKQKKKKEQEKIEREGETRYHLMRNP